MNIAETKTVRRQTQAIDLERFRLRRFVESLGPDELETGPEPIDLADVADVFEGNPKAVLFRAVGPERQELVGNVDGEPRAHGARLRRRGRRAAAGDPAPPAHHAGHRRDPGRRGAGAGGRADRRGRRPHRAAGASAARLDGGPYISSSTDFVIDPKTGWTNVGVRRLMLRGRREAGIDLVSPSDLRAIYEASAAAGKPLPVSFVVGSHPIDHVAATMRLPVDELGLVASLRDAPLPVVKCVTNDIRVPADAEWVLEGYLDARGHVEPEGPVRRVPRLLRRVEAQSGVSSHRDHAAPRRAVPDLDDRRRSLGRTDTAQLNAMRTELMIWRALETAVREPLAVYATPASGGMFNMRVALRQRVPGEARNAIAACFGALVNIKNVFVVDPDIDIFSDEQIDWALATRFQPDRDLVVMDGHAHLAARSVACPRRPRRRQGRVRSHLAVRHRHAPGDARARAAALCRPALRLDRGRARRRTEILRGPDERGRQPRRTRGRARARGAARRSTAIDRDGEGRYFIKSLPRGPRNREIRGRNSARPRRRRFHRPGARPGDAP